MQDHARADLPDVHSLAVMAYELNSVALKVAAEAETLARRGTAKDDGDPVEPVLIQEMDALIRRLQEGTRALRFARLSGQRLRG